MFFKFAKCRLINNPSVKVRIPPSPLLALLLTSPQKHRKVLFLYRISVVLSKCFMKKSIIITSEKLF